MNLRIFVVLAGLGLADTSCQAGARAPQPYIASSTPQRQADPLNPGAAGVKPHRSSTQRHCRRRRRQDLRRPRSIARAARAKIATRNGLWDAHTGRRLAKWNKGDRVFAVFRLREREASVVATTMDAGQSALEIVSDTGARRRIAKLPELVGDISVRPQDDIIHFFSGEPEALLLHRVDIDKGTDAPLALPKQLCVNEGSVLPASACNPNGPPFRRQKLPETAELPEDLPVISPPVPNNSKGQRGGTRMPELLRD